MTQDELKKAVAHAALDYVVEGKIVGVGTGSTARLFIDALAGMKDRIVVPSPAPKTPASASKATASRFSISTRWMTCRSTSMAPTRSAAKCT